MKEQRVLLMLIWVTFILSRYGRGHKSTRRIHDKVTCPTMRVSDVYDHMKKIARDFTFKHILKGVFSTRLYSVSENPL